MATYVANFSNTDLLVWVFFALIALFFVPAVVSSTPTLARGIGGIVAIEEVMPPDKSSKGRRTSLRAGSASQVFARPSTASEDKDAGHGPEGRASVGHAFKTVWGDESPPAGSIPVRLRYEIAR